MIMKRFVSLIAALGIVALVISAGCTGMQATTRPTTTPSVTDATENVRAGSTAVAAAEKTQVKTAVPATAVPLRPVTTTLPKIAVPEGSVAKYYTYTLDGKSDIIGLALPTSMYEAYTKKADPSDKDGNEAYFLAYMNDREQQPYISALAKAIQEKTAVTDDQARIAVSLVQHIPYHDAKQYRYPYEVMYSGEGVCGEKAMLMAALLRELGYGSAVFYFEKEDHMTAGIAVPAVYGYRGTKYAFIEATEPNIITYDGTEFSFGTLSSVPDVIVAGNGKELTSVEADYNDARMFSTLVENIKHLTTEQTDEYDALDAKYDLSYYTCQKCKIPAVA